jgi:hypothetical protein
VLPRSVLASSRRKSPPGSLQGDILKLIRTGVNDYTMENYPALQLDKAINVNGVTLAPGDFGRAEHGPIDRGFDCYG